MYQKRSYPCHEMQLSDVQDIFHLSYLDIGGDFTYSERPVKILDTAKRVTYNKVI
jgi:hypothetical protein